MINESVRALLKNLIPINNSMVISPIMTGKDEFKSVMFKTDLTVLDKDIEEFGIFDTSVFLSAMDLMESPEITFDGISTITAKDENTTVNYITSTISSLDYVSINPEIIDSSIATESCLEFPFTKDTLANIKKAKGVFKSFDTLFIDAKDSVTVSLGNENTFSKTNNSWTLKAEPSLNPTREFFISLPLDSIMKLPDMDYTLRVKYNEKRDAYRIIINNEVIDFLLSLKD